MWNSGIPLTQTARSGAAHLAATWSALVTMAECRRTAAFGNPVVPEVNWIWVGLAGSTTGSRSRSTSVARTWSSHPANGTVTSSAGYLLEHVDQQRCHVGPAEALDVGDAPGPGLPQQVGQLRAAQRRVRRDQHQAGQGGAVLQHHPLADVRRPHRQVVARGEPVQQPAAACSASSSSSA